MRTKPVKTNWGLKLDHLTAEFSSGSHLIPLKHSTLLLRKPPFSKSWSLIRRLTTKPEVEWHRLKVLGIRHVDNSELVWAGDLWPVLTGVTNRKVKDRDAVLNLFVFVLKDPKEDKRASIFSQRSVHIPDSPVTRRPSASFTCLLAVSPRPSRRSSGVKHSRQSDAVRNKMLLCALNDAGLEWEW